MVFVLQEVNSHNSYYRSYFHGAWGDPNEGSLTSIDNYVSLDADSHVKNKINNKHP